LVNLDKEKEIEKLLKEGVLTWDQICQKTHSSPNTISKVDKQMKQNQSPKEKSNRTKALEMYHQGYTTYQVATGLDIPAEEAERCQLEYWKLIGMNELAELYGDNRDSIKSAIDLHYELDARGTSVAKVCEELKRLDSLRKLGLRGQAIATNITTAQIQLDHLIQQRLIAENQLNSIQQAILSAKQANADLLNNNHLLREENERCRRALHILMTSDGYNLVRSIARSEIIATMSLESQLVPTVAACVVKALTNNPQLQSILSYPYASESIMSAGTNSYLPTTESELVKESSSIYDQIKKHLVRTVVNSTIDTLGRN
jgi:hypothetical protein